MPLREELEKNKAKRRDEKYMKLALKEAKKARDINEVPIGCVIVRDDKVIGKGYNKRNTDKNVLSHAELIAIKQACKKTGDWRLEDCTMYITLEPCQMCAGAMVQARLQRAVIGSMNPKAGIKGAPRRPSAPGSWHRQYSIDVLLFLFLSPVIRSRFLYYSYLSAISVRLPCSSSPP